MIVGYGLDLFDVFSYEVDVFDGFNYVFGFGFVFGFDYSGVFLYFFDGFIEVFCIVDEGYCEFVFVYVEEWV